MVLTIPQVRGVGRAVGGRRLADLVSACLVSACFWLFYGLRKGDKTIYLAFIGSRWTQPPWSVFSFTVETCRRARASNR